jgi:hypothetical protein
VKSYRPYAPDQSYLLPPSPNEWLPKGHLAYFVLDLMADLDLGEIESRPGERQLRPIDPAVQDHLVDRVHHWPGVQRALDESPEFGIRVSLRRSA